MLMKQIFNFIKLLNSDKGAGPIAAGIVCGMFLGFTPSFSPQTVLIFVVLFLFRVQIGAALLAAAVFKVISFGLDPVFDAVGGAVLAFEGLRSLFTILYNLPIVPFTRFNNSIVMGAGVVALVLAIPVYLVARKLIDAYRAEVVARFEQTAFWKMLKATSLYQWYVKYEELRG